jgi:AcrR family transcriptional regulator
MVQKESPRRGRPRAYDPETALGRVRDTFWDAGFSGTSLDDLSAATGMNRPSLYGAFGDKRAIYQKTLERYRDMARQAMNEALGGDRPLREALRRVYDSALSLYFAREKNPRGCFMIGTGITEAVQDPDVRASVGDGLREIDRAFEARIRAAQMAGELPQGGDAAIMARLASAVLHSLAVRSRAGDSRRELETTVEGALDLICGADAPASKVRRSKAAPLRPVG